MNSVSALDPGLLKPRTVTNVTLHWYTRGIEFRAAEAPRNGGEWSERSGAPFVFPTRLMAPAFGPIQSPTPLGYSLCPRTLTGSCTTGGSVCI